MRHLVALPVVATLAASSALSGCATLGAVSSGQTPTVTDAQQDVVQACGLLPSAESIAALLATQPAAAAGLTLGETIAGIVCGAAGATVTKRSFAAHGTVAFYAHGVHVTARRVSRSFRVSH